MMSLRAAFTGPGRVSFAAIPPGTLPGCDPPPPRVTGTDLCALITDWRDDAWHPALMLVEQKHDGVRAVWHSGDVVTRNEVPIRAAAHILPGLLGLERQLGGPHLIDAEILHPGGFDATLAAVAMKAPPPDCIMVVFDAVPLRAWEGQADCLPLIDRKAALFRAMQAAPSPFLRYAGHAEIRDPVQVRTIARKAWALGHEGIVAKDGRSIYPRGRTDAWRRLKRAMVAICPVVGVDVRDGLGTLLVSHKGRVVRVTAGFGPDDRRWLAEMGTRLVGRLVEIEAMDTTASGSLRQPRFSLWRERA
jgi:ATP-dependent DNA ligase